MSQRRFFNSDPVLFRRIKEYFSIQEGTLSATDTVEYLKSRFPEYNRKKHNVLLKYVQDGT